MPSAIDATSIADPALEARYLELTHELRCMQCQNESIADSPVGLAADLRREVRDMLLAGKTDEQVRNYMVSRYGEFILFRPRFSLRNAWLWFAPPLFLLIGALVAVRVVRQRAALARDGPMSPMTTGSADGHLHPAGRGAPSAAVLVVACRSRRRAGSAARRAGGDRCELVIAHRRRGRLYRPGATGRGARPPQAISRRTWWRGSRGSSSAIRMICRDG